MRLGHRAILTNCRCIMDGCHGVLAPFAGDENERTKAPQHLRRPPPTKFHPQEPHGRKNQHFKLVTSPPLTPPTNSKTPQNWTGSCGSWSISAGLWIIYPLPPFTTPNRQFYKSEKTVLILKPLDCFEPQAASQAEQYFPGYGNFIPLIAKLCKRSFWICPPQRGQCYRMSSQGRISGLFSRTPHWLLLRNR